MARKYEELRSRMPPERRERSESVAAALLVAMDLVELREARGITQEELARRLEIVQSNVSRLERRDDMRLSTLRAVVEALGGELRLVAKFPEGAVRLRKFESGDRAA